MTSSKIFSFFCLSFVGGIFLSSFFFFSQMFILLSLVISLVLITILWGKKKLVLFGFCFLFLLLGILRQQTFKDNFFELGFGEISFVGMVVSEPDVRAENIKLTIGKIEGVENKVLVTVPRYPEYEYGDKLKITGEIKPPVSFEDFNYPGYLAKDGIYAVSYYPEVKVLEKDTGNIFLSAILKLKKVQGSY